MYVFEPEVTQHLLACSVYSLEWREFSFVLRVNMKAMFLTLYGCFGCNVYNAVGSSRQTGSSPQESDFVLKREIDQLGKTKRNLFF